MYDSGTSHNVVTRSLIFLPVVVLGGSILCKQNQKEGKDLTFPILELNQLSRCRAGRRHRVGKKRSSQVEHKGNRSPLISMRQRKESRR